MSTSHKAFVLLSGGVDSSTCLGLAIRDVERQNVVAFSVDYGQRHTKEMDCARRVANYFSVPHEIIPLQLPKAGVADKDAYIPSVSYSELKGVSPTYVPFRNGNLISQVAAIAQFRINELQKKYDSTMGSGTAKAEGVIYIGTHAEDAAGDAYPDCRLDFIGAMAAAVYIGTYHAVRLRAPLIESYKDEIVLAGQRVGVPWHLTWSCYKGEDLHCGVCPTCRARKAGFAKAKVKDPTQYADPIDQYNG